MRNERPGTGSTADAEVLDKRSRLPLMRLRTCEYLRLAIAEPKRHPVSVEAIAEFVPVNRRIFYKAHPGYEALLNVILAVREGRTSILDALSVLGGGTLVLPIEGREGADGATSPPRGGAEGDTRTPSAGLTDEQLGREIGQTVTQATWALQRFVGQRKRTSSVDDAPLVLHDMEQAYWALGKQIEALRPLVVQQQRRRRDREGLGALHTARKHDKLQSRLDL